MLRLRTTSSEMAREISSSFLSWSAWSSRGTSSLYSATATRLSSFSRLILLDKRGIGASDRPRTRPTLEAQMEDVRAVLDAVGSSKLWSSGLGTRADERAVRGHISERTTALVLYATAERAPGTSAEHQAELRRIRGAFGVQEDLDGYYPGYESLDQDEEFLRSMSTLIRASASPGGAVDSLRRTSKPTSARSCR